MWRAHRAGLSADDLRNMTPDELDLWLELEEWVADVPDEDAPPSSIESERAFFHM